MLKRPLCREAENSFDNCQMFVAYNKDVKSFNKNGVKNYLTSYNNMSLLESKQFCSQNDHTLKNHVKPYENRKHWVSFT